MFFKLGHLVFYFFVYWILVVSRSYALELDNTNAGSFLNIPPQCHAMSFSEQAFEDFEEIPSSTQKLLADDKLIWKFDIVCVSDNLIIDEPIFSNGGNVLLLGNSIQINEKIDTRVYRQYHYDNFFHDWKYFKSDFKESSGENIRGWFNVPDAIYRKAARKEYGAPKSRKIFEKYYECVDCRDSAIGKFIPRLPDGATPPIPFSSNTTIGGTPPPNANINFHNFGSGNIVIFGNVIDFSSDLDDSLEVSGLSGGLPGLGHPNKCTRVGVGCYIDSLPPTKPTSSGSIGGDAGNVVLYSTADNIELVKGASNLTGGIASDSNMYRIPHKYIDLKSAKGTLEDLIVEGQHTRLSNGEKGEFVFVKSSPTDLIEYFLNDLNFLNALREYNYPELVVRAETDERISSIDFEDFVVSALDKELRNRFSIYTDQMMSLVQTGKTEFEKVSNTAFCAKNKDIITDEELSLFLNLLSDTCDSDGRMVPFLKYIENTGGILNVTDYGFPTNLRLDKLIVSESEGLLTWNEIKESLNSIELSLLDIYESIEVSRLETKQDNLQKSIKRLEKLEADAENPLSKLVPIGQSIGMIAGSYAALESFSEAISAFQKGIDLSPKKDDEKLDPKELKRKIRSKNLKEISKSGGDVYKKLPDLKSGIEGLRGFSDDENLNSLRQELEEVIHEINLFTYDVASKKKAATSKRKKSFAEVLTKRRRYASTLRSTVQNIPDYYRYIFLSYANDPSSNLSTFEANSKGLSIYISQYPEKEAYLQVRSLQKKCEPFRRSVFNFKSLRVLNDCLRVKPGNNPIIVEGEFLSEDGAKVYIPLYSFSNRERVFTLPMFGFDEIRSR